MTGERIAQAFLIALLFLAPVGGCGKSSETPEASFHPQKDLPPGTRERPTKNAPQVTVEESSEAGSDLSDAFFKLGSTPSFRIQVDPKSLSALERDPRTFVHATVLVDDTVYHDVGIHLKGRIGSFRPLDSKPGFTVKFNKFVKGQRFHGMEKIHLNNAVQDPSYMTEILCSQLFRDAGVPAARAANARVELNGRTLGFYVLVEGISEDMLQHYFADTRGNLYDFPYAHDITSPEVKESKDRDASDLRALASAAKEPDLSKRWQRLERVLDLNRFIDYLAIEVMIWDWDCYAMCRNNYRVYHDPTSDKIVFMPHGMDQIFHNPDGSILPAMKGLVARSVLEIPEGRRRYFERMKAFANDSFTAELMKSRIQELDERMRPVLVALNPKAAARHDDAVARLQHRVLERIASVQDQLKHPPSQPEQSTHFP